MYIIRQVCFSDGDTFDHLMPNRRRSKRSDCCALGMLGSAGKDPFDHEVETRVPSDFECRTEVAEFYSKAVRGHKDLPLDLCHPADHHRGWEM